MRDFATAIFLSVFVVAIVAYQIVELLVEEGCL